MDIMQLIQMLRSSSNPQSFMINLLEQQANNNPMLTNILSLVRSGNTKQVELIVRNLAKQRGIDFDKELINFKSALGVK